MGVLRVLVCNGTAAVMGADKVVKVGDVEVVDA